MAKRTKANLHDIYELGIAYHNYHRCTFKGGYNITGWAYVLSKNLEPFQIEYLNQFNNVKIIMNGCTCQYAPEIKYDVLFIGDKNFTSTIN